jgi:hypothetical protein
VICVKYFLQNLILLVIVLMVLYDLYIGFGMMYLFDQYRTWNDLSRLP